MFCLYLIGLAICILMCVYTYQIIENKGYDKTICWGHTVITFFFGLIGLLIALCRSNRYDIR